jgi:hypothetical protein
MSVLTRHVLYEKFNREKAAENFFVGFLNDHEIKLLDEKRNYIFYMKNDEIFMQYNKKTAFLCISYYIWNVFEKNKYNYCEITKLIKRIVWEHLMLKDVTPTISVGLYRGVWKPFIYTGEIYVLPQNF